MATTKEKSMDASTPKTGKTSADAKVVTPVTPVVRSQDFSDSHSASVLPVCGDGRTDCGNLTFPEIKVGSIPPPRVHTPWPSVDSCASSLHSHVYSQGLSSADRPHGLTAGQKRVRKAADKARKGAEDLENVSSQLEQAQGNVDAVIDEANEQLESVVEQIEELDPHNNDEIKEDYRLDLWRKIDFVTALGQEERGMLRSIYSLDGLDQVYGEGIPWVRRWMLIQHEADQSGHCRGVNAQAFQMRTEHADIATYHVVYEKRWAAGPMQIFRSFPNFQPREGDPDHALYPTYPYVKCSDSHEYDARVSLRVAAMIKWDIPAVSLLAMDHDTLVSAYRMRAACCNVPGDDIELIDNTLKFLHDVCLDIVNKQRDAPTDPMNFRFGTFASVENTRLPTGTVGQKAISSLWRTCDLISTLLRVAVFSVCAFLVFLLAWMLMAPSFPVLILTTSTLLLGVYGGGSGQCVLWLISLLYVLFGVLSGGTLYAISNLFLWVPTILFAAGLANLLIRFGVVSRFFENGRQQISLCRDGLPNVLLSLSVRLITLLEYCTRRQEQSIAGRTPSRPILVPTLRRSRPRSTRTRSLSSILQPETVASMSRPVAPEQVLDFIPQITRALRLTSLQRLCVSASWRSIAICSVMLLIVGLSVTISQWHSRARTVSISATSASAFEVAECLVTCVRRWATDSQISCSCSSQLADVEWNVVALLKATTASLLRPG